MRTHAIPGNREKNNIKDSYAVHKTLYLQRQGFS